MDNNQIKIRTMKLVLLVGAMLMGLKFLAYYLTHSNGILTDAMESIVNVISGMLALYALYYAAKPKDEDHPYGHGKIEFMSSGVEGGMVLLTGLAMLIKGAMGFLTPFHLSNIDWGVIITLFSGLVNYFLSRLLTKKGKSMHSSSMVADGKHLLTDTWSSAGLVLALVVIYFTNWVWVDLVITMVLGIMITYTGFQLIKESFFNLLDKTDYEKIDHLISFLNSHRKENWIDIHNLRVVKYGSVVHVDCHMTLPWYYSLEEAHKEVDALSKMATATLNYEIEFFIHADPCLPDSCSICGINNCEKRLHPLIKRLDWNLKNVLPDSKHSISEG